MKVGSGKFDDISYLNYARDDFGPVASKCAKVRLEELERPFRPIGALDHFARDLLEQSLKKEGTLNVNLHSFVDGTLKQKKQEDFFRKWDGGSQIFEERVLAMDFALRVTNVQNVDAVIKGICQSLTHRFKTPTACNMYITPHGALNCLGKHSDFDEIFIFQLMGKKRWSIFQDERGEDLRLLYSEVKGVAHSSHRVIEMTPGDIMYLPCDTVHKAECVGNFPSIHLTFSVCFKRADDVYCYLVDTIRKEVEKSCDFKDPVDFQSLKSFCEVFQSAVSSLGDPAEVFKEKQFYEAAQVYKRGRVYPTFY